jgi:hypothetical protein
MPDSSHEIRDERPAPCHGCGFDRRHARGDGACPECGLTSAAIVSARASRRRRWRWMLIRAGSALAAFLVAGIFTPIASTRADVCLCTGSLRVTRTRLLGLLTTTEYSASPIELRLLSLGRPVVHDWAHLSTTATFTTGGVIADKFRGRKATNSLLHWQIASLPDDQFLSTLEWLQTATEEQVEDLLLNPGPRGVAAPHD